ncbi:MAG: tetratricopeptide repeat protein [Kiritimatiellia bacterium]
MSSLGAPSTLARGRLALEDGFHSQAANIFQSLLRDPGATDLVRSEAADSLLRVYAGQQEFDRIGAFLADPAHVVFLDSVSRTYWRAVLLDRQGDWQGVLARLAQLPEETAVASARVLQLRALAHLQLGQFDEAIVWFERLATQLPDALQAARNRLDWGRALHSAARYDVAIEVWEPLMVLTNQYPQLAARSRYLIGETRMQQGAYAQAESVLVPLAQEVGQGDMLAVSALILQAQARRLRGDLAGATDLLRAGIAALGTHSLRRRLQIELGRSLLDGGELVAGQQVILEYASEYADSPEAPALLLELGRRMLADGRYEHAIEIYKRYLEAFGDRAGVASHGRGLALRGAGRHGEAAIAFDQSHQQAPEGNRKEETLFLVGQSRYDNGQYRMSLAVFDDYMRRYPEGRFLLEARLYMANALAARDQLEDAVSVLAQLALDAGGHPLGEQALLRIGELYMERSQWPEAEEAFDHMIRLYPNGALVLQGVHGRGVARYHQWHKDAQQDLARVAAEAVDPSLREHARFMLAMSHFRQGEDLAAIESSEALLRDVPDSIWAPEIRFRLAQFAFNAGRYESAEQAFLDFVEKHPGHAYEPQSLLRAGLSAISRQQFVSGNELLGRMAQQFPQHAMVPYARFQQAEALVQLGRHSTAILMFQEVIRLAPNSDIAYMAWGREGDSHFTLASEDPSRYEAAARAYQVVLQGGAVQLQDRLQAAFKLGLTYEKMGRPSAALEQYYDGVIIPFHLALEDQENAIGAEGRTWYSRAVRNAVILLDAQKAWQSAVSILERAATTDADIAPEAARRASEIRSEYWDLFY